jgi:hypothetical protein
MSEIKRLVDGHAPAAQRGPAFGGASRLVAHLDVNERSIAADHRVSSPFFRAGRARGLAAGCPEIKQSSRLARLITVLASSHTPTEV